MPNLLSLPDTTLTKIISVLHDSLYDDLFTLKYQSKRLYKFCLPFLFSFVQISFFRGGGAEWKKYECLMRSFTENPSLLGYVMCVDLRFTWPRSNESECEFVGMLSGQDGFVQEDRDGRRFGGGEEDGRVGKCRWVRRNINDRGWCLTGPGQGDRYVYYREGVDWKSFLGWS